MSNQVAVVSAVKAFTSSFPDGRIDVQEAFSSACDVAFSLVLTIAATANMPDDVAIADFIKAIERRSKSHQQGKLREWKPQ